MPKRYDVFQGGRKIGEAREVPSDMDTAIGVAWLVGLVLAVVVGAFVLSWLCIRGIARGIAENPGTALLYACAIALVAYGMLSEPR